MAGSDPTSSISSWAGGGAQTTLGAVQYFIGLDKAKKNKRPTYEIPPEIQQNLSQAQQMALEGLPEEQKQQYISNLQRGTAFGLNQIGTRKGGLAGVAALNEQENQGYSNLLAQDSAARQRNQGLVMNARQTMADYRDQAFQVNKLNPYYEKQAEALALQGAGMQNVGSGLNAGAGATLNYGAATQQPQQRQLQSNASPGYNYNPNSVENDPNNGMYDNIYANQQYNGIG